jgi:hypothetical protein
MTWPWPTVCLLRDVHASGGIWRSDCSLILHKHFNRCLLQSRSGKSQIYWIWRDLPVERMNVTFRTQDKFCRQVLNLVKWLTPLFCFPICHDFWLPFCKVPHIVFSLKAHAFYYLGTIRRFSSNDKEVWHWRFHDNRLIYTFADASKFICLNLEFCLSRC